MHTLLLITSAIVAIFLFTSWVASQPRGTQLHGLVNVGEGFQPNRKTFLADAAIATRYLLVKAGTDAQHVALCGAADLPLGNATDEPGAAEEGVSVNLFGIQEEGTKLIASGAIAANVHIYTDANGKVQASPTVAGTYYRVGLSLSAAAADGDAIEVVPFPPQKVVVIALLGNTDSEFSGLTISGAYSQAEMQALRAKCEELGDDVRALAAALATPALVKVLTS